MSTLKVNTIQTTSGVEVYTAKAWVNFNGTFGTNPFTVANGGIRAAGNVTSVTDGGTGNYTVNFASGALSDANYSAVASHRRSLSLVLYNTCTAMPVSSSSVNIRTGVADTYSGEIPVDSEWVSVVVFR